MVRDVNSNSIQHSASGFEASASYATSRDTSLAAMAAMAAGPGAGVTYAAGPRRASISARRAVPAAAPWLSDLGTHIRRPRAEAGSA